MATDECDIKISNDDRNGFDLHCTTTAGRVIGTMWMMLAKSATKQPIMRVANIELIRGSRGKGIGTAMYEVAAQHACAVHGMPLASGLNRSDAANGFWRKQERKDRAICSGDSGSKKRPCLEYVLSCPAPVSLAGARKRKRK